MRNVSRREFLKVSGAGVLSAALPSCAHHALQRSAAHKGARPNVIVILSDDQGYGDLACHGNPVLHTPNLDRLHAASVRFTDFHVAPMCSPTRGQLLTGMDCLRNGALATCMGRHLVREGIPTIADAFAAGGYRTGLFGKWHVGNSYPYRPMDRGFQEAVYFQGYGLVSADAYWGNDYFDPHYLHNGAPERATGYCTDVWFDKAMAWMNERARQHEPFFCYLPTNAAHFPMWVAEKYRAPYEGRGPAGFFGMLANLDENIGRLDAFLRRNGLHENTIVIFMSDNGYAGGAPNVYNAGMRGGKCARYDGGHRTPCFVRWPSGGLRAPGDVGVPAQVQDIFPTLLDLCGVPAPAAARFDGMSLAPLLKDSAARLPDRMLVVQYCQKDVKEWDAAVIWNQWRLVFGKELYDIANDVGQANDVAAQHPDVVQKMRAHYETWWAGVAPLVPMFVPLHLGSSKEHPVMLTSSEWQDVRCDGADSVRKAAGGPVGAPWRVLVEQAGTYEIELRRWPREADTALDAGVPEFKGVAGSLAAGVALPIASAHLKVGGKDTLMPAVPGAKSAVFTMPLAAGTTDLHGWFCDPGGKEVCGAYYAYVTRR